MQFEARHGAAIISEYHARFMATIASRVVRALQDAGVRTLFGVPGGGSNLDLIAGRGATGLPFVLTSTETGAAIAALAQAEVTAVTRCMSRDARTGRRVGRQRCGVREPRSRAAVRVHRQPPLRS